MQLLVESRAHHQGRRALGEREIAARSQRHEEKIRAHQRAITEQRGKEALEERAVRELRDEFEGLEARERDEIASTRLSGVRADD